MTIFILVSILLVAALAIALLLGVSPASPKVKVRAMYVGAAHMLVVALIVCDYIDALPDFPSKFRFHTVLILTITASYLCISIAFMEKYNNNPSDIGLIADYASYMRKYADFAKKFEQWENEDLNDDELAYYIEVQTRVNQKLLDVTYN